MNTDIFTVSPSRLEPLIAYWTSRKSFDGKTKPMLAPFVWGAPGIGKTEIIRTIAASRTSRLIPLHLPQYDPTDLKGIPVKGDDGRIRWMPTSYLPQQRKILIGSDYGFDVELDWDYAESIAVYVFDKDGEEIASCNDPVAADYGYPNIHAERIALGKWRVSADLGPDAHEVIIVDKAIIFLDELSAAEPSTQNAALQLVLDRRVGEYDVPYSVPIISAGNREDDGAFVQALSHPLVNRFGHVTLVPNSDDWIEWGVHSDLRPEILGMIKAYPDALFEYDEDVRATLVNGQYGFTTPRTWKFMSDQYADLDTFINMVGGGTDSNRLREAERLRLTAFAGIIGKKWASAFIGYIQIMHELPSADSIMRGDAKVLPDVERSKSFGLLFSLVQKLKREFKTRYNPDLPNDKQSPTWITHRDNILDFITNNFDVEMGTWAGAVVFQDSDANTARGLRGEAMMRFSTKFVHTMTRLGRKKA